MGRKREVGLGGALVALAAACGLTVGLRSVVALEWPGVRPLFDLPAIPPEGLGLAWSPDALFPAQLQEAALERMAGLVAALFLAALAVAFLNALVLLLESGTARWREVAVRASLGATPLELVRHLLADVRRLAASGLALGLLLGLATGGALRAAWPGLLAGLELPEAAGLLLPALAVLAGAAMLAYAAVGFRTARRGALSPALSAGARATEDRGAVFLRRVLSSVQTGAAGAVLLGSLALALSLGPAGEVEADEEVRLVSVSAPGDAEDGHWGELLERVARLPGVEAESLATPGALLGLGVRDPALADCGACSVGGLPLPFRPALADHHAVTPGFTEAAALRVVAGRDLTPEDVAGAEPVALVNETFAGSSFQDGDPLGRKVRLGMSLDRWYTVVGVVADARLPVVGGDDRRRAAVYVSAHQLPPRHAQLLYRGGDDTDPAVTGLLAARGYSPGEPRSLAGHRRAAAAPLGWLRGTALFLGGLTLLLALHGAHVTALQVTRRRTRDLAVRRVLGADDRRILLHVLRGAAGVGLGGALVAVFFGSLLVAFLRKAAAGVSPLGPEAYVSVIALLVAAGVLASLRAAREALQVVPARAVAGERRAPSEPRRGRSGS